MSETIGQKLQSSRQEKRLSIEQVSAATRIRLHYLEALERDDLSAIPSVAQARGFLRIYADFLGLNVDEIAPMPRQPEPVAPTPIVSKPPSTDLPAAPVQGAVSAPASARPNLLTSLRERFMRRSENPSDAFTSELQSSTPEPEFVPAHYTEELPAEPAPVVIEEPAAKEVPTRPVRRSSSKKTTATKKSASIKKKTSPNTKKPEEKKKITRLSRPKRASSLRKPSSSQTLRVSKKM